MFFIIVIEALEEGLFVITHETRWKDAGTTQLVSFLSATALVRSSSKAQHFEVFSYSFYSVFLRFVCKPLLTRWVIFSCVLCWPDLKPASWWHIELRLLELRWFSYDINRSLVLVLPCDDCRLEIARALQTYSLKWFVNRFRFKLACIWVTWVL